MMRYPTRILILMLAIACCTLSCDRIKQKTKSAINKSGETVGKGASEFIGGVSEGIGETFECKLELSGMLTSQGVQIGKFQVAGTQDSTKNLLVVYFVFNKD